MAGAMCARCCAGSICSTGAVGGRDARVCSNLSWDAEDDAVCMYVCMCKRTHMHAYLCVCVCVCVCTQMYIHECVHTCIFFMHAYIHSCMVMYAIVCIYVCMYMRKHVCEPLHVLRLLVKYEQEDIQGMK